MYIEQCLLVTSETETNIVMISNIYIQSNTTYTTHILS